MLAIFKPSNIIEDETAEQLEASFSWIVDHFDRQYFHNSTTLIHPSRDYFPDRADNEFDMATLLCRRILSYSGLSHWPFEVVQPTHFVAQNIAKLNIDTSLRLEDSRSAGSQIKPGYIAQDELEANDSLYISYSSAMMKKPMDLVGAMTKNIAQHYLIQSQLQLPHGPEAFDATAEILAIFMGFGLFIANSAYTFRGSCARGCDPRANRNAALSENEALYCLALFSYYKNIQGSVVTPHLKSYLRSPYKKAVKQIEHKLNEH